MTFFWRIRDGACVFFGQVKFSITIKFFLSWDFWVMLWDWILYFYSPVVLFFHSFVNLHKGIV